MFKFQVKLLLIYCTRFLLKIDYFYLSNTQLSLSENCFKRRARGRGQGLWSEEMTPGFQRGLPVHCTADLRFKSYEMENMNERHCSTFPSLDAFYSFLSSTFPHSSFMLITCATFLHWTISMSTSSLCLSLSLLA